jgi:type VI secretion system secreted protein Hcp
MHERNDNVMAEADFFLKINGIPGESTKAKHVDEIEIQSWGWGQTNSGSHSVGGGGGAGKVMMQDFSFSMPVNKASPEIFLACATGKHIPDALLTCRKSGGQQQEFLKIKFTDLLVSSHQLGGDPGSATGLEQVTFNFAKIEVSYAPQKKDGSLDAYATHWYDVKTEESA